ncbi:MAG: delta-aminolevulinic acid dehydratase [Proteobacteria bacterium]|nr:delta-aminolevulinic acid dehydratase [Pseudomonadota bacterium]
MVSSKTMQNVREISDKLYSWMSVQEFKGWDPFDALNSPLLQGAICINRWAGVAALQLVKRSPINLRHVLLVPKTINAKGIGLVLMALTFRYRLNHQEDDKQRAFQLARWLKEHQSKGHSGACWGYPFEWPNRAFYAPKGTPTIVNTSFIADALLDLYELSGDEQWLTLALSSCEFLVKDLKRTDRDGTFCFSYTPIDNSCVHNANLLGASLLARAGNLSGNSDFIDLAMKSAAYSMNSQRPDGSWPYGEATNQAWIDSFHTGYNILALKSIYEYSGDETARESCKKGYKYYLRNFFLPDGTIKFYHNRIEPLDAHAFAHAIICLTEMADVFQTPPELVEKVLDRMVELFWSGKGYFYWQIKNGILYKLACMRWVESWALLALTQYLQYKEVKK